MTNEQIKAIFLANGFSIKEGNGLRPYVYQAARALLEAAVTTERDMWRTASHTNKASADEYERQLAAQAKENEVLRARVAELEELRKDAERYRWLCDGNGYFMEENSLCGHDNDKEEADAEIDAAMAKQVTKS